MSAVIQKGLILGLTAWFAGLSGTGKIFSLHDLQSELDIEASFYPF